MKIIRCAADRAEGNFTVLVSDEGKLRFDIPRGAYSVSVGDVVDVYTKDGKIIKIEQVSGEAQRRLAENELKLNSLFNKGKR